MYRLFGTSFAVLSYDRIGRFLPRNGFGGLPSYISEGMLCVMIGAEFAVVIPVNV